MNIAKMLKQAQKMQNDMQTAQAELQRKTVEASVAGGKVVVSANGAGEVLSIKIDPALADPNDVETLEDVVLSGVQQALAKSREVASAEMGKVTGGLNLPGMGL